MKLYNTLTRATNDISPLDGQTLRMYSCGPTVYDHIHIGNLSSFIFADTLRRSLQAQGLAVKHIMNFTDVDDKTIRRSRERYPDLPAKEALLKLTEEYEAVFLQDMQAVGNATAGVTFVKATDYIADMQALIRQLHAGGFAYIADDGVYFSIEAYRTSGKQYGQLTEITASSTGEARIANDEYDKESAHDFALWKTKKEGEPVWEFELDGQQLDGRPGWHIECSVMSSGTLGQPFDIHTGGVDLIFPHHENEIAQSTAIKREALYAATFAHNEHLLVDGQKMSKSRNNFCTLADIIGKGFEPLAFRLLVLQAHYRSQAHFSWDNLQAARNRLQAYRAMAALRWQAKTGLNDAGTFMLADVPKKMSELLANDLNTPAALAYLSTVTDQVLTVLIDAASGNPYNGRAQLESLLQGVDALLGLGLAEISDITDEQKRLVQERETARQAQDWQKADELRGRLAAQSVGLRDTPYGPIWFPL